LHARLPGDRETGRRRIQRFAVVSHRQLRDADIHHVLTISGSEPNWRFNSRLLLK
jgi:hypothetical protein